MLHSRWEALKARRAQLRHDDGQAARRLALAVIAGADSTEQLDAARMQSRLALENAEAAVAVLDEALSAGDDVERDLRAALDDLTARAR